MMEEATAQCAMLTGRMEPKAERVRALEGALEWLWMNGYLRLWWWG